MEPTEEQYLIINALDTLGLLGYNFIDENNGIWYIETPSTVLPIAKILPNGEIVPITQ
ncbi:hypothetical protein [Iningainema tapete]|uniref:Uncharacterized protein n=1 Tax=Iningainema tapete BLCC-T55 TaxID=2748662 RepID=A0A8J6XLQ8_9CYAN|nr:hypothetical protein [Iningainema tapete]MBD2770773.1 hypothetical protein [Iningainema tapete BLCC-T55]